MQGRRQAPLRHRVARAASRSWTAWKRRALVRSCIRVVVIAPAVGLAVAPGASAQEIIDRVLAVASGEVITLSDVRTARELGRVDAGNAADPVRAALEQLIERALILEEADRFAPPEPSAAAVDAALASVIARAGSRVALDARLARLGVDLTFVRELLRQDLRISAYLNQRFTADTAEQQRRTVEEWVDGLRRRADIVDLYDEINGPTPGTGAPGRD